MAKVGFVGLGVMGGPMAGHLVDAGHDVTVWNRTASKADPLKAKGAKVAGSLEELGEECNTIFLCVTRSEDVAECAAKLTAKAKPGTLLVDHSTILPKAAKQIYDDLKAKGFRFIDAPITGGSMGAQKGQLTIFCGGADADVQEILPIVKAYAKRAERVGESGAGQTAKMANQIAVGASLLALCESLSFAEKAGLNLDQMLDMLGGGAAGSWSFANYGPKLLARDWSPGFKVKDQVKDFNYCIEAAKDLDAAVPGTILINELMQETLKDGLGEKTTAALFETLMRKGFED
jgi:3-hydroxyisobutyrate dehydrogenase-like beta-hydroxyacid dehydrogenase